MKYQPEVQQQQMIKTVVIPLGIIWILYSFFGMKMIYGILSIVLLLLLLIYFNQNKILYMPLIPGTAQSPSGNPMGWRHPTEQGCTTENVQITTSDSLNLKGWLIKGENSRRVIIYFHENAGNLGLRIRYLKNIHQYTDSDVLIVGYRGYSDSQGIPTQAGLQLDSQAILDWAVKYKNKKIAEGDTNYKIYLLGRSLGGAVSLYISTKQAYRKQITGLVLENTFTNINDMIGALFPILKPISFLQRNFWPSITRIVLVKQPILFIRSLKDEIVPPQQMRVLYKNAINAQFRQDYQILEGTHNVGWQLNPDAYFDQYNTFFGKIEGRGLDE